MAIVVSTLNLCAARECVLELPVYDATGKLAVFDLASVKFEPDGANLLQVLSASKEANAQGSRLRFPKAWLRHALIYVELRSTDGKLLSKVIELTGCEQKVSLQLGERDTGLDVRVSTVEGRLVGCQYDSTWWVRAVPMFGGQEVSIFDAVIRADGSFILAANLRGERHLVVIGRGDHPLVVFGANFLSGGAKTDLGDINLRGACVDKRTN